MQEKTLITERKSNVKTRFKKVSTTWHKSGKLQGAFWSQNRTQFKVTTTHHKTNCCVYTALCSNKKSFL